MRIFSVARFPLAFGQNSSLGYIGKITRCTSLNVEHFTIQFNESFVVMTAYGIAWVCGDRIVVLFDFVLLLFCLTRSVF